MNERDGRRARKHNVLADTVGWRTQKTYQVLPETHGSMRRRRILLSQTPAYVTRQIRSYCIARWCARLCPSFRCYPLCLPTKRWPGWVGLGDWLHINSKMVCPPEDGHQFQYLYTGPDLSPVHTSIQCRSNTVEVTLLSAYGVNAWCY